MKLVLVSEHADHASVHHTVASAAAKSETYLLRILASEMYLTGQRL